MRGSFRRRMMSVESSPRASCARAGQRFRGRVVKRTASETRRNSSTFEQGSLDMKPLAILIAAAIAATSSAAFAQGTDAAKGAPAQAGEPAKSPSQSKKKSKKKKQSQQQSAPPSNAK